MILKFNKQAIVGKHFTLTEEDKRSISININKLIGQLEKIKSDILTDNACDESLTQVMAVKGGVASLGKVMISKGILECMENYSKEELELIIKNMMKL